MKNIQDVFQDNGYSDKEVINAMAEKETTEEEETEENNGTRGIVVMPNIPGFTRKFNKIARDHRFKVANKAENKVRDLLLAALFVLFVLLGNFVVIMIVNSVNSMVRHAHGERLAADGMLPPPRVWPRTI